MKSILYVLLSIYAFCPLVAADDAPSAHFDERLRQYLHPATAGNNQIGRIIINDRTSGITQSTWLYVNAALTYYKKTKPSCIILELNTPGGEVFAAQRISDALKDFDAEMTIPVIAYINNWAISAGAMLAYSCRFIVIAKDASMGAAEPVLMPPGGGSMESASEKINSAMRADFANRASYFDRNPYIAEAMVDKDVILVQRHGKIIKLNSEDEIIKSGSDPDIVISPKGKLLTLRAEEMMRYGIADQMILPMKTEPLTEKEEQTGDYALSKSSLSEIAPLEALPQCRIDTFEMNWQTQFLAFLTTPYVSSILFFAMMVGLYIEISSAGFGVAGVVAVTSLFFIVLSSFALEAVHWLEPLLFLFGCGLLTLEIFFFPTLGLLGFLGAIFMIIGLAAMMLPGLESVQFTGNALNAAGEYVLMRASWLAASILVGCVFIVVLSRYMMPKFRVMQRFVLQDTKFLATGVHEMNVHEPIQMKTPIIGEVAIVVAPLRPAGKIQIGDAEFDALSSGGFVERGKKVRVLHVEGAKIMVEEVVS